MSTLVTGGTGFVGINLVRDLAAAGHEVVSVDVGAPDVLATAFLAPWAERVHWVTGDLTDPAVLAAVGRDHRIDRVVHAAAYTPYEDQERTHFRYAFDNNLTAHLNLIDFVVAHGVARLLFVSTMAVYSPEYFTEPTGHVRYREDEPLDPHHVYGIGKLAGEALQRRAAHLFGFDAVSVRLAQNWGPMERVTPFHARMSIPWYWAAQAAAGEPIVASPHGSGVTNGRRLNQDHPYVLDTARAVRGLLTAPTLAHDVYNVSAGDPVFVDDLLAAIRTAVPDVALADGIEHDDASRSAAISLDVTRLTDEIGFVPEFDLASALAHCVAWRREAGAAVGLAG